MKISNFDYLCNKNNYQLIKIDKLEKLSFIFKCINHNIKWKIDLTQLFKFDIKNKILEHLNLTEEEYIIKNIIE